MIRRPPRSTRTDTLFPYTTLFRSNLKGAQAQVAAQQALVDKKSIRAPFDGHVGIRLVDLGQYLTAGQKVTTLQRSEEHTSELQSLMRISYAVFCLKKKNDTTTTTTHKINM